MDFEAFRWSISMFIIMALCMKGLSAKSCEVINPFSRKTPYDHVANKDINVNHPSPTCTPIQINMINRHGHRYPSSGSIKRMKLMFEKLNRNSDGIASRFNLTFPIKFPFEKAQSMLLTTVGEKDFYGIGKRIKSRFPSMFQKPYTPLVYKFRSTCKLRCVHSANSLAAGLFENTGSLGSCRLQPIAMETADCHKDPILRFYDLCKKWGREVDKGRHEWLKEYYKFRDGQVLERLTKRINQKLGLKKPSSALSHHHYYHLHLEDVKQLYSFCAYDIAMFNGDIYKGICSLLDKEAIELINYLYDLSNFYYTSAGHQLNYDMSCPLLADMYFSLQDAKYNRSGAYTGIFRSGHAETLAPILTLLGVYVKKGEVLKADNYEEMRNRTYRSACISPFSGNMYFILYRCEANKYKIQLYVNENLVKLPCCKSSVDCDLDAFLKYYENIVKGCDLKKMCKV